MKGKKNMFFSAFFSEIDSSSESLYSLQKDEFQELLLLPDSVEEFRTITLYESVNMHFIEQLIRVRVHSSDRLGVATAVRHHGQDRG